MKILTTEGLRKEYLDFFARKGHAIIKSASLIPDNDPTVLFTTAGMHPLVPYLMGAKHPAGTRLANVQKCVRTGDIDEVGDDTHCTFFEMLGNWSLGDYFKAESIGYSFEFLTKSLEIPVEMLAVSVFEGDSDCPRDDFSGAEWEKLGIAKENIYYLPKKNNWWGPAGATGPCGPDTEIFFIRKEKCGADCTPACDCGRFVEIWNNVFMEYDKKEDGSYMPLKQKNVDTGMGLERTVAMINGYGSVYEIDVFSPVIEFIKQRSANYSARETRIIAEHVRTATFMLGDEKGITPANVDQGYVLRRLIRRALRYARKLGLEPGILAEISQMYIAMYAPHYSELEQNAQKIIDELNREIEKFDKTLNQGIREFEKLIGYIKDNRISGKAAFRLYDTYGFPIEMTIELAQDYGIIVDEEGFKLCFAEHQAKSQAGAEQKFKGGLADNGAETALLHTATHLLNAALKKVLNDQSIHQKGSNITAERLRFDFNFHRPLTKEELAEVENEVNRAVAAKIDVVCEEMSVEQAKARGAEGVFGDRYDEKVKVYTIDGFSSEICGGPHAANTGELRKFKIAKEQSSSSGVRRIKAVLES